MLNSDKANFIVYVFKLKEIKSMENLAIPQGAVAKRIEDNGVEYFVPGILHAGSGFAGIIYQQTVSYELFKTFELLGRASRSNHETAFFNARMEDDLRAAVASLKQATTQELAEYLDGWRLKDLGDSYDDILSEAIEQAEADFAPAPYLTETERLKRSLGLGY